MLGDDLGLFTAFSFFISGVTASLLISQDFEKSVTCLTALECCYDTLEVTLLSFSPLSWFLIDVKFLYVPISHARLNLFVTGNC